MNEQQEIITIDDLLKNAGKYIDDEDKINMLKKAYVFAYKYHEGQKNTDGEDYILHPLNVANILTKIKADYVTLCAALLHATDIDDEVKNIFGEEVLSIVVDSRKISKIPLSTSSEYLINYYKKILIGICEDARIIILKLADRLHNMRILYSLPENKQKEKAKETLEILVPLANHLGIHYIKSELEDLCLRYLKPDVYYDIVKNLNNSKLERDNSVIEMKNKISDILNDNGIKHQIKGRSKSIYSIYKKMENGKRFNEIYDILALRVYVDTESECYLSLGLIHSKFKPLSKRFKDYIAMPKENMYQSLHTTIFGIDGQLFEVQIRTFDMDQIAEYGVASHWAYKEKVDVSEATKSFCEQKLQFFRTILEKDEKISGEDLIETIKSELNDNDIYVYTPKGDVIQLPKGSTPIDFAYRVHTEIGDKMVGAIVNDNIVSLDYELRDGDVIKVNINKSSKGPSKEWVNIVKTSQARDRIKSFYTKIDKKDNIKKGQELLEKELRKSKIAFNEFYNEDNIKIILKELAEENMDEIYLSISNNKYSPTYIINLIYKEEINKEDKLLEKVISNNYNDIKIKNDIIVSNIDAIKVNLASCCKPIKGDEIIGYITKGKGITIHRSNCHNISNIDERLIDVKWNDNTNNKYQTNLVIRVSNKDNFLMELISKASTSNIGIQNINTINNGEENIFDLIVLVENTEKLDKFIINVNKIQNVIDVERIIK
ncbi:MAG: RelA/SpoT family protein [Bacilli bacterium]|nr:RelA/SpoT family protein [Bacilli bacterium]